MKEVSEVVKEYNNELKAIELKDSFNKLLNRTKILVKSDLCNFEKIEDLDKYTKVEEYLIPIVKDNNLYNLYKNNKNDKYYFIFKNKILPKDHSGIIINYDHLAEEDIKKVEHLTLEKEKDKSKKIGNDSGIFVLISAIYFIAAIVIFFGSLQAGEIGFMISIPLFIVAVLLFRVSKLMDKVESLSSRILQLENK